MSFSEDPYKHIAVVYRNGVFGWECNGCGADSLRRRDESKNESWTGDMHISDVVKAYWGHVANSHRLFPSDTEDWS